jgi:uncharacterized protein
MWKLSQFTVTHSLADRGLADYLLVFNTRTGKAMAVTQAHWQLIMSSLHSSPSPKIQQAIGQLHNAGIFVPQAADECKSWQEEYDLRRRHPRALFPLLAITSGCNLKCTYCYETGIQQQTMSHEVIAACTGWMERRIVRDGIEEINPALFGGEPLLVPELLFLVMDQVGELRRRYGVRVSFYCSSNGTLLTDELAAKLAEKGLQQIQISLDGPAAIHDARRMGKRGEPSFRESLRGLRIAASRIRNVTVKVNFDAHNRCHVRELLDFLAEQDLAALVNVKLEPVADRFSSAHADSATAWVIPPTSRDLANAYVELMLECRSRGIRVTADTGHTTPCMFTSEHGIIIDADGSIYKCVSLVGRKEFRVGSALRQDYDQPEYGRQMDATGLLEQCFEENCHYIPVCAGGCAYESIVRTGDYRQRFCAREYLSRFHYLQHLMRDEDQLLSLGMRPLTAEELRSSDTIGVAAPAAHG